MTEQTRYTDEEIQARFDAAEARTEELEKTVLAEVPSDIIDKFRIGADKELFSTLLIAPGMELDEGMYCVQASVEADLECGIQPHELILVRSYVGPRVKLDTEGGAAGAVDRPAPLVIPEGKPCIMLRTEAPTKEQLLPSMGHYLCEPESWQDVVDWARALRAMDVAGWED